MATLLERMERQAVLLNQPRDLPVSVRENLARAGVLRFLGLPQPVNFDAHANFAYSTVATAPSPATSGTSLVLASGDGAKFPAAPFNAVVWPTGAQPLTSNAEIVRVTAKSTDTLTITRTQEGTSARSIVIGDQIAAAITAKTITDIEKVTAGLSQLVYRYTVTGSDKASIDTGVDTPDAGSNDWTNGDLIEVLLVSRTDEAGAISNLKINFNNDTGANYYRQFLGASNTTLQAFGGTAESTMFCSTHGASGSAFPGLTTLTIANFAGTTFAKIVAVGNQTVDATAANMSNDYRASLWNSTSAITRLAVAVNTAGKKLKVGSQLLIYKRLSA